MDHVEQRHLGVGLSIQRLVRSDQELGARLLTRSRGWSQQHRGQVRPRRRGRGLVRDDRLDEPRLPRLAPRRGCGRGAVVRADGRKWAEPQPDRRVAAAELAAPASRGHGHRRVPDPDGVVHHVSQRNRLRAAQQLGAAPGRRGEAQGRCFHSSGGRRTLSLADASCRGGSERRWAQPPCGDFCMNEGAWVWFRFLYIDYFYSNDAV